MVVVGFSGSFSMGSGRPSKKAWSWRTAERMARVCAGVVPAQPPTPWAPSSRAWRANSPRYSGLAMYSSRPSTTLGSPALGCRTIGRSVTALKRFSSSSSGAGPLPPLTPTMSAPHSASLRMYHSGSVP